MSRLAWILATHPNPEYRDGEKAAQLSTRAVGRVRQQLPALLDSLAASHAEAGRFPEATSVAKAALRDARQLKQTELAKEIEARIKLYDSEQPYRQAR